eukprot:c9153_g1_i1.p1 GENE.c9153_g1_i1~~c9153_g1_i1.p1  ORF type:complete len:425 (-),score=99.87 c9153_g1_i1:216-1490(-)
MKAVYAGLVVFVAAHLLVLTLVPLVHSAVLEEACTANANCTIAMSECFEGVCTCVAGWGSRSRAGNCEDNIVGNHSCYPCSDYTCQKMFRQSVQLLAANDMTFDNLVAKGDSSTLSDNFQVLSQLQAVIKTNLDEYCSNFGQSGIGCECCTYSQPNVASCAVVSVSKKGLEDKGSSVIVQRCYVGYLGMCVPEQYWTDTSLLEQWCLLQHNTINHTLLCEESQPSATITASRSVSATASPSPSSRACGVDQQPLLSRGEELVDREGNACVLVVGQTCTLRCKTGYESNFLHKPNLTVVCDSQARLSYARQDLVAQASFKCKAVVPCLGWRNTGGCNWNGTRQPRFDRICNATVPAWASGYCECGTDDKFKVSCGYNGGNDGTTTCACQCGDPNAVGCSAANHVAPSLTVLFVTVVAMLSLGLLQ